MNKKRIGTSIAAVGIGLVALTGCGARSVDVQQPFIEKVEGLGTMYATCTKFNQLIMFTALPSSWDDSVDYEAYFANACTRDYTTGRIIYSFDVGPAGPALRSNSVNISDGDLGNTQPGTEDEDN